MDLGSLFGAGSVAEQMFVYGVLQQVVGALTTPGITELGKLMNRAFPEAPIAPGDAAAAAARSLMAPGDAADAARESGFDQAAFDLMRKLSHHAPDISAVLVAYRRGLIGQGTADGESISLHGALADAGIPADWFPIIEAAAIQEPTGAEVMNALLEGQIDRGEAERRWKRAGNDPTWFQAAYDANGEAPTPVQALELLNRGIIARNGTRPNAVSYEQAFLEGPWRNKWLPAFLALAEYLPPPRTVSALVKEGAISHDRAAQLLAMQGLSAENVTAYLFSAHSTATVHDKTLAKTEIVQLYKDKLVTRGEASAKLVGLHYTATDAKLILDLADAQVVQKQYSAAVSRIRSLFLASKITAQDAVAALAQVGVPATQTQAVVATWEHELAQEVRVLTPSQFIHAWYYKLMTAQEALDGLVSLGYSKLDAWLLLAIKNQGAPKDLPRPPGKVA